MRTAPAQLTPIEQRKAEALRVLIVDDDPIHRETSRMFLSMYGRVVTLGANGTEGLARAAEADFDIMIVDLEMPDMTGLEVIARIRQMPRHRDLPIIMVTSRDDSMAIDRAYELGAASFVVKPVNWTLLDHYIRFVCRASGNEIAARQAHAKIEALAKTKDNLMAVVRHEMKTPLSAILGFTRLAAEAQASGDVTALSEQLAFVRQSGERLLASFSDMATYSDLISRRGPFNPVSIPASWIVGEVQEHCLKKAQAAGIELIADEGRSDLRIDADQALLVSAIVRIVDNAFVHAGPLRSVEVSADQPEEGWIRLRIADDGVGMDPARIAICLEPFSQENMSLARSSEGLGLGLPIAVEIARLHGGRLKMASVPGGGTRVEILLPRAKAPA